jgi:hypothetical protein
MAAFQKKIKSCGCPNVFIWHPQDILFPSSAWERLFYETPFSIYICEAELRLHCVPKQSLGTR